MKKGDRVYIRHPRWPDQWQAASVRQRMLGRVYVATLIGGRIVTLWVSDGDVRKTRPDG